MTLSETESRWYAGVKGSEVELAWIRRIDTIFKFENADIIPKFEHNITLFLAISGGGEIDNVFVAEKAAIDLVDRICGLWKLFSHLGSQTNIKFAGLFERDGNTLTARFPVKAGRGTASGRIGGFRPVADVWAEAHSDRDIKDVLAIFGRTPLCWFELYKVIEICCKGLDESERTKTFGTKRERDRFKRTANHSDSLAGPEARHARCNEPPPCNPMNLDEARKFILKGVLNWLRLKKNIDFSSQSRISNPETNSSNIKNREIK
jgi:hypothetical protein